MFLKYQKDILKNEDSEKTLSTKMKLFSSIAPKDTEYKRDDNGNYYLSPTKEGNITGIVFVPTPEMKRILGDKYNDNDILKLSYNAQIPFMIKPKEGNQIAVNGKEISIDEMVFNKKGNDDRKHVFYINPAPFQESDNLKLKIETPKCKAEYCLYRKPNSNLVEKLYETGEEHSIEMKVLVNGKTLKSNFRVNPKTCHSTKAILGAIDMINSILSGNALINGMRTNKTSGKISEHLVRLWNKVQKIEKVLNIEFYIDDIHKIDKNLVIEIEELYQCLCNKHPVALDKTISKLHYEKNNIKMLEKAIGSKIIIGYTVQKKHVIFDKELILPEQVCLINAEINAIKETPNELVVEFKQNEDFKLGKMIFKNNEEADRSLTINPNDLHRLYIEAKNIDYYLFKVADNQI